MTPSSAPSLPPGITPADLARAIAVLRAQGKHRQADYLASFLPPHADLLPHLDENGQPPSQLPLSPNGTGAPGASADEIQGPSANTGGLAASGPPKPPNPQGAGSLPPRIDKAYEVFGNAKDEPHSFGCVFLPLPEGAADRIRMLAAMIPDEDLADSGRESEPHLTLLYGL